MIIELVELARHLVHAAAEGCLDPLRVIRCQNRLEGGFEDQPLRHPPPPSMTGKVVGELSGQPEGALDVHSSIPSPGSREACRAVPCIFVRSFSARTASSSAAEPSPPSNSLVASSVARIVGINCVRLGVFRGTHF